MLKLLFTTLGSHLAYRDADSCISNKG